MLGPADATVGVYVHVPFCERICPYCDFAVVAARPLLPPDEDRYVSALLAELASRSDDVAGRALASIYLGGGTPSLLRPERVKAIVETVARTLPGRAGPLEVTLEVNPSTVERERLPRFRDAGVNRLSIGIQSFDDRVLRRLGRAHRADEGRRTLEAARAAGFENVSLDLLFAGPDATPDQLTRDLQEAVRFAPEHVSAYELSVEAGTPFATAQARGQLVVPEEEESLRMHEQVESALEAAGLLRYELSSYARPGRESAHNRRYWERRPVLGLGMGAWSTDPATPQAPHGARRANTRHLATYLERIEAGRSAEVEHEILAAPTARGEALFLGLRCTQGFQAEAFRSEFGAPPRRYFGRLIDEMVRGELLEESLSGDLRLTRRGRMISDSVFERFV